MNPLLQVRALGQQIWLDNLSRALLNGGVLACLISEDGIAGITTNPAIFQKAIADGHDYKDDLARLKQQPITAEERYERLAIADVQRACDLLRPLFEQSRGNAGYVSLEVSPALAFDAEGTVAAGKRLHAQIGRPNLLIKVPATPAGLVAVERLIGDGINVNVTLLFSLAHAHAAADAYLRGLERLRAAGGAIEQAMSVASLFLSRVDTLVDARIEAIGGEALPLRGQAAVAMARLAYRTWRKRFHGSDFAALRAAGARPQYLLWASTGTKNPAYDDLLYVEPLIGAETVTTLPDATLAALRDHGRVNETLMHGADAAHALIERLASHSIDMSEVGEILQADGLALFEQAFAKLLEQTATRDDAG
ncbi:MAG: transaldolase [Betaproteobacteria bacterium]|nr:transaldolase [Betaproteobacteria bacterium]